MLIFGARRLVSLKNYQVRPQNSFSRFILKIQLSSKKLSNKKIFGIKFLIKRVIFIFGVRWILKVAQWTSGRVANQVLYFCVPKYCSSDVFPAPEIVNFSIVNDRSVWEVNLFKSTIKKSQYPRNQKKKLRECTIVWLGNFWNRLHPSIFVQSEAIEALGRIDYKVLD